jgi:poly(hydroxyalkanoate) depolymerase family esterase
MINALQKRLLRTATLFGAGKLLPPGWADMTVPRQTGLPGAAAKDGQANGLLTPSAMLARGAGVLDQMQTLGLTQPLRRPQTGVQGAMLARQWSGEAGNRPYKLFVPPTPEAAPALLIMLHGCTQTPEDFAAGTRMNALAEASGFLVLYPEQIASANPQRCWNWFNPGDQARGAGEAAIIAGMASDVTAEFGVDPKRVFAAGLSAGGAKAAVLGMAYPDIFRAIGVHSGLACGAARDIPSALTAMRQGEPGQGRLRVPAIVFHGDKDGTVNPANAAFLAAQANDGPALQVKDGQVPGGLSYTRSVRAAGQGRPAFEQWMVHGLGHAWSGGSSDGSYTDPRGPDASKEMLRFFLSAR